MNWAMERRLDYIDDQLTENGVINRGQVVAYFGVTIALVSLDLRKFATLDPKLSYNKTARHYERKGGGTVRGSTPDRRAAWRLFE